MWTQRQCYTEAVRNLTLTLDEETARWARLEAARQEVSVSRLVRELLRSHMRSEDAYGEAMRSYSSRLARPLQAQRGYPARHELHDRAGLR